MKVRDLIADTEYLAPKNPPPEPPLVSVLMPTFRRAADGFFMRAARSALDQSLRAIELIIVDDASTDGTFDQIRELMARDGRVSCLRHRFNVGLPAVSEYEAFLKARADHIAFGFDDDEFYPQALEQLLREAVERKAAIVHGHVDFGIYDANKKKMVVMPRFGAAGFPQALLSSGNYISNNAVLLHRSVVETVGFFDPHVAIARLCDWDLWRRVAAGYPVVSVDVSVGKLNGPTLNDSLGNTYPLEPWLASEWMQTDRNALLLPATLPDYDVLAPALPLTRQTRAMVAEVSAAFRTKAWYPEAGAEGAGGAGADAAAQSTLEDGRILVASISLDASITLYFEHLPPPLQQRVRVLHGMHAGPEELVGASAVIIGRDLQGFSALSGQARALGVPLYYFLDDNLSCLAQEKAYRKEYGFYTPDSMREALRSFRGVLLSTEALVEYFKENRIHDNLLLFPPVVAKPAYHEQPDIPPKGGAVRIAFFGGRHRQRQFAGAVFEAICRLAAERPVELFAAGVGNQLPPVAPALAGRLMVHHVPFELSYDRALGRFASYGIEILVHPNSRTANNRYKTLNVLINAAVMGAVPVISDEPPYDRLAGSGVAHLCGSSSDDWLSALRRIGDNPDEAREIRENLAAYCRRHFGGERNVAVLEQIIKESPDPGLVLRDKRFRALVGLARQSSSDAVACLPGGRILLRSMAAARPVFARVDQARGALGRVLSPKGDLT